MGRGWEVRQGAPQHHPEQETFACSWHKPGCRPQQPPYSVPRFLSLGNRGQRRSPSSSERG